MSKASLWLVLTAIALAPLFGCSRSAVVRYRLTIEIEDQRSVRSGSAVWENRTSRDIFGNVTQAISGDAVRIDLPGRSPVFAVLQTRGPRGQVLPVDGFMGVPARLLITPEWTHSPSDLTSELDALGRNIGASADFTCLREGQYEPDDSSARSCPVFVRFRDVGRPETVEGLDPNDLATALGTGVRLRRLNVTITDEPVTRGIEATMGWLSTLGHRSLDGYEGSLFNPYNDSVARGLTVSSFSR